MIGEYRTVELLIRIPAEVINFPDIVLLNFKQDCLRFIGICSGAIATVYNLNSVDVAAFVNIDVHAVGIFNIPAANRKLINRFKYSGWFPALNNYFRNTHRIVNYIAQINFVHVYGSDLQVVEVRLSGNCYIDTNNVGKRPIAVV